MSASGDLLRIEPAAPAPPAPAALARLILDGFDRHYALFRYSAQRAKALFESGDWHGIAQLSRERIEYYDTRVRECARQLEQALAASAAVTGEPAHTALWQAVKQEYVSLLAGHRQPECAETFYNSVSCRVLHRDYFHNTFLFVRPAVATDYLDSRLPAWRVYYPLADGLRPSLTRLVADFGLALPFADLPRDVRQLARAAIGKLRAQLPRLGPNRLSADCQIQVLSTLFFRNTAAYVVGRLVNQGMVYPFALALVRNAAGQAEIDALLAGPDDLSALFSFTRAYFLVDTETPSAVVAFLASLVPRKPPAELYTMIGLQKQGKTLFYRDFLQHLAHSHDVFDVAPGIRGMVMCVFTLPSYPYVFKLIRDRSEKDGMTPATVRRKYQMVKLHDRVGRLADTWEYSQVALPRARFAPRLLAELRAAAPSLLEETDDTLIIRHVYIERRMTPLNLYLRHASDTHVDRAVRDYGDAIRQLASANIFPGDMLYKNFGMTRLGRVVFYDYDEIQRLTEMQFRAIPPAPDEEAEMSGEAWYPVGANDVFPEEFESFLLGDPRVRRAFMRHHAELLQPDWWQACQARVARGRIDDFFPYDTDRRLRSVAAHAA
ncbi:bifunctional isocitrate dehydrogenase kinase/phosphatase [Bordetella genomosp. 5]|uniref:Isocitrate dehydrogenase kinase/phosphatase n=1 Tax=Bordetella genomosp. 5 TaxID=1395608 RepID=A0A261TZH6_9BORD|nr:bifunctional isocitrate dehydrogenase kinase/phosphatase [Bordetella genomosp. 5]OZI33757.1 bifunctional isocitrate dehydrogenase kinase/phosphatase [Bordetella genomosp. 5]OZI55094.1 bifunctional isocitrate dehydrogenase kinase/phosphatase [Bordetella genomosp. 5]